MAPNHIERIAAESRREREARRPNSPANDVGAVYDREDKAEAREEALRNSSPESPADQPSVPEPPGFRRGQRGDGRFGRGPKMDAKLDRQSARDMVSAGADMAGIAALFGGGV